MGWGEWRRLVEGYLRPHLRLVVPLGLTLVATIGLQIASPQLVRLFVDQATSPRGRGIGVLGVLYLGAVLLQQGFRVMTAWLSEVVGWLNMLAVYDIVFVALAVLLFPATVNE